jgi:hypothetical protein
MNDRVKLLHRMKEKTVLSPPGQLDLGGADAGVVAVAVADSRTPRRQLPVKSCLEL